MSEPPPKRAAWFRYTDNASLGIEIAVAISIGAVGGIYLEKYVTHWSPWTTLIGIGVGLGAAVKAVLRTARAYQRELANMDEGDSAPPQAGSTEASGGVPEPTKQDGASS